MNGTKSSGPLRAVRWTDPSGTALVRPDGSLSEVVDTQNVRVAAAPLLINGSAGSLGTLLHKWDATTTTTSGTVARYAYNRSDASGVLSQSPIADSPNAVRLTGNGGGSQVYYGELLPANLDATTVRTIGIFLRAGRRADGGAATEIKVNIAQDNGSLTAPNFGIAYADVRIALPADGRWRFCAIPASAASGQLGGDITVFIPGTSNLMRWVRIVLPVTADASPRSPASSSDWVEAGPLYLNPKGAKAAAIVRFDDNAAGFLTPMANWATAFPSGFNAAAGARSDISISAVDGAAMNVCDLVAAFGFQATHFILTGKVGGTGYATLSDLRTYQDTYGHLIGFQTGPANPVGSKSQGARLLGPIGYSICPAGSITGVAGTVATESGHSVPSTSAQTSFTQGYPVQFAAGGLPATLTADVIYWLRYRNATTYSVHPTEANAGADTNAIDLTGATAASMSYRYAGSANDSSAILAEFAAGRAYMQAHGLNGHRYYAPNQHALDVYVEEALLDHGFDGVFGGGSADDTYIPTLAAYTLPRNTFTSGNALALHPNPSYVTTLSVISTDAGATEASIRNAVRAHVQERAVFHNCMHSPTGTTAIRALCWYLDELKYWSDQGLLYVDTADRVAAAVTAARILPSIS